MIADFLDWLAALPPAGVVAVAGLLVFGECTLGLGFVAPAVLVKRRRSAGLRPPVPASVVAGIW